MIRFTPKLFTVLKERYTLASLRSDLLAGLTVAIVALPLSMAFGIASGASPEQGILSAIIGGFFISFFGGSRVQIGGPTGAFIVVILGVIGQYGYDGLLIATLLAGGMLVVAGYARLGELVKFIPQPVIIGFTSGIAVIIASTQLKDFLGLKGSFFTSISTFNPLAFSIGVVSAITIYLLARFFPKLPRYLLALVIASLLVFLFRLDVETIGSRFSTVSTGIPMPSWPEFSFHKLQAVLPSAFTIAFLAGVEALLSAVVADGMTGYKHRPNQELIAQGVANVASTLFGGLPVTGALARTATNVTAGGKTPFAGIFHALFLLLFVLLASQTMTLVPMPALAAVLFFVAWGMSEAHRFFHMLTFSGSDRIILLLTFILTICVDLTVAIGVGVALSSLLFVAKMSRSIEISPGIKEEFGQDREEDYQRGDLPKGVEVFWIAGPIFFGIAAEIPTLLKNVGEPPKMLIIRMRLVPFLDTSGACALDDLVKQCWKKNIGVVFSALKEQPKSTLTKFLQREHWNLVHVASSYDEAITFTKSELGKLVST